MEEELTKKAELLQNLADVSMAQGDYDVGIGYAKSALELWEKLGDKQKIIQAHMYIHVLYSGLGREDRGLEHLEAVKVMVEEDPDSVEKGLLYQRMAHGYLHLGQPSTALNWAQTAVDIFTRLGVPMGTSLGTAWIYTGRIDEGIAYNEKNWPPVQRAGNWLVTMILGHELSLTLALVRDIPRARTWGEKALPEVMKFCIPALEVGLRRPLALIYTLSGEIAKAEAECQAVKTIENKEIVARASGSCPFEDVAGIGFHYLRQGEWDSAIEYLEGSIRAHQGSNVAAVGACYLATGSLNLELGNYAKAEELLLQSLEICRKGGNVLFELWVVPVLAELYLKMGQPEKAAEYVDRGFELLKPEQNWYGLPAPVYLAKGMLATAQQDWGTAAESFDKAIQINRQYQLPWDEARALYERGLMYLSRGRKVDRDKAHEDLDEALAIFQKVGAKKDVEKVLRKKKRLGA
jgi:tetratricopeptide (TPR) repeat protein